MIVRVHNITNRFTKKILWMYNETQIDTFYCFHSWKISNFLLWFAVFLFPNPDSFFISFYTKLFGGLRGALCIMFKWWKALHKTALLFIILEFLLCNNKSQFKLLRSRSRLVYSYNVCSWKSAASVKLDWRMYCFYYFSHFHGCGLCHWEFSCFSAAFYNDFLSFYTFPFDFLRDASSFSRKKNVDVQ